MEVLNPACIRLLELFSGEISSLEHAVMALLWVDPRQITLRQLLKDWLHMGFYFLGQSGETEVPLGQIELEAEHLLFALIEML